MLGTHREPVMLLSGLISAALIAFTAFGVTLPEGIEGTLQAAVAAVVALIAALKVRAPGQPTVVIGGLISAFVVLLTTFGVTIPEEVATSLQVVAAFVASYFVRENVTPAEPAQ